MFRTSYTALKFSVQIVRRTFLSSSYSCEEKWTTALASPLINRIRLDEMYNVMEKEAFSAVDLDLFAMATATSQTHHLELRDLLHKFRISGRAGDLFESTGYSVIRSFLSSNQSSDLIEILDDRLNYGIFLCEFTASMLLDHFIVSNDFESASKVASFLMLQEDFYGLIPEHLALFATNKYLNSCDLFDPPPEPEQPKPKKKPEEIKVRVGFLRNPYFDDHFDLHDLKLLAGKTLAMISKNLNDPVDLNNKLIGWIFYKKYDKANKITNIIKEKNMLSLETIDLLHNLKNAYEKQNKTEDLESLSEILSILNTVNKDININLSITKKIENTIKCNESNDIQRHSMLFDGWENLRKDKLKQQIEKIENMKRTEAINEREKRLKYVEKQLWFYDNRDLVKLQQKSKIKYYSKRWWGKIKKPKVSNQVYIPPKI